MFENISPTRLTEEQLKDIDYLVRKNSDKYTSRSMFVRVAVIRLIREEKQLINK